MKDRIPTYPGRVKLTPVAGQANVYDMVRADEPIEAGTALNKATLLTDQTAAKYGKDNTAVPDNIFNVLSKGVLADSVDVTDIVSSEYDVSFASSSIDERKKIVAGTDTLVISLKDSFLYSTDGGKNWNNATINNSAGLSTYHSIPVYSPTANCFVASTSGGYFRSTNGSSWTTVKYANNTSTESNYVKSLTFDTSSNKFVSCGNVGSTYYLNESADGTNWTSHALNIAPVYSGSYENRFLFYSSIDDCYYIISSVLTAYSDSSHYSMYKIDKTYTCTKLKTETGSYGVQFAREVNGKIFIFLRATSSAAPFLKIYDIATGVFSDIPTSEVNYPFNAIWWEHTQEYFVVGQNKTYSSKDCVTWTPRNAVPSSTTNYFLMPSQNNVKSFGQSKGTLYTVTVVDTQTVLTNVLGEELKGVLKTVTGSYTGTGTDTPLTLEFPLKLRYLVIVGADQRYQAQYMVTDIPTVYGEYIYTIDFGSSSLSKDSSSVVATTTASGSAVTIQKPDTANLNQSNAAYQYLAIGVAI